MGSKVRFGFVSQLALQAAWLYVGYCRGRQPHQLPFSRAAKSWVCDKQGMEYWHPIKAYAQGDAPDPNTLYSMGCSMALRLEAFSGGAWWIIWVGHANPAHALEVRELLELGETLLLFY